MAYTKLYSKFQTFQVEGNQAKRLYVDESLDQDWNILWILFLQFHIVEAKLLHSQHFKKGQITVLVFTDETASHA